MTAIVTRTMPVLFAVSGAHAVSPVASSWGVPDEAEAVVIVAARRLDRPGAQATLGAHVMSPGYLSPTRITERVTKLLRGVNLEIPPAHLVPATTALPAGLATSRVPIVVLTLEVRLGLDRLENIGRALRALREENIVLAGIAHDTPAPAGSSEMLGTISLLLGAAHEDDRIAEIGTHGGLGFVLLPQWEDAASDQACSIWNVEAAGEMPREVLDQLRPFLLDAENGENRDMRKKGSPIYITRFDKTRLMQLLRTLDAGPENRDEMVDLEQELDRGTEVDSTEIGPDVVTMNSTVRVTDLETNTTSLYTIVFPSDADLDKGRISILSPLGTALLGYRAGDIVAWEMPGGTRRLRIEELVYQPEAAGDYHL